MKNDQSESLALAPEPAETLTVATTARMMESVIKQGITADSVGVMERLMGLMERADAKQAEKDFAKAFVALQYEMPSIQASKAVPNNDGSIRYKFAPYEEIMAQVRPLMLKHGFTVTFSCAYAENRIIQSCTLQHTGGHSRTNSFAVRIGKGPPGSSEAQGDGAASTYAKRFALCNALNITVEMDDDGKTDVRNEGDVISPESVTTLREQIAEANWNEAGFLKLAGVERLEDVREGSYPVLMRAIQAKKAQARKSP